MGHERENVEGVFKDVWRSKKQCAREAEGGSVVTTSEGGRVTARGLHNEKKVEVR